MNNSKLFKKFGLIIIILCCVTAPFSASKVSAEENVQVALKVTPAIVELILDPDSIVTQKIRISNLSNFPQPIKSLKQSFSPREKVELSEEQLSIYDASSWITLSPEDTDFILQPHESKEITLNIKQPDNATPGGHYATLIFEPLIPQELVSSQSVFVYSRVAVLIFMQTKGDIVQLLEYGGADIKPVYQDESLNFNITLKNSGNTHIQPSGKVNIYNDLNGELIKSFDLSSSIVLPGTSKSFPVEGNLSQLAGKFSMESVIKYGSDGEVIKSSRQSFIIFPYTVFLFAVLPFAVLMFFIIKYRRRFIRAYKVLFGRNKRRQKVLDKGTIGRDLLKPRSGLKSDFAKINKGRIEIPKNSKIQKSEIVESEN